MGKRSTFDRMDKDFYATTDPRAVEPLVPHLRNGGVRSFAEPCAGDGALIRQLTAQGFDCNFASDIELRGAAAEDGLMPTARGVVHCRFCDALDLTPPDLEGCDAIITNPPWRRDLLHPMIRHFTALKPTWLLFYADWSHTVQAAPYMELCARIVSVGRIRWFAGTKHSGMDNCAWYLFRQRIDPALPVFVPRAGPVDMSAEMRAARRASLQEVG